MHAMPFLGRTVSKGWVGGDHSRGVVVQFQARMVTYLFIEDGK